MAGDAAAQDLDLAEIYQGVGAGDATYRLRSMVGFYVSHYSALVRDAHTKQWLYLDDEIVRPIGNWGSVLRKCGLGKIQPSVLFFERCE